MFYWRISSILKSFLHCLIASCTMFDILICLLSFIQIIGRAINIKREPIIMSRAGMLSSSISSLIELYVSMFISCNYYYFVLSGSNYWSIYRLVRANNLCYVFILILVHLTNVISLNRFCSIAIWVIIRKKQNEVIC